MITYIILIAIILSFCFVLVRFYFVIEECHLLKEENQYFLDIIRDIRNPLTLVKSPLEELYDNLSIQEVRQDIRSVINNLAKLDKQLVNLSNFEDMFIHSEELWIAEHELGMFLEEIVAHLNPLLLHYKVDLRLKSEFSYANVYFDENKMRPLLEWFIINIVRCSENGSEIQLLIFYSNDNWGLESEGPVDISIFKPNYFREGFFSNQPIKSSGVVGGVLIKKLLQFHDGAFVIDRCGQKIKLVFPNQTEFRCVHHTFCPEVELEEPQEDPSDESENYELVWKSTIILVETNEELMSYLVKSLSDTYNVYTFGDGVEALEEIKENIPELIIAELALPSMSGNELCSRLKTNMETAHIPVILLSPYWDKQNCEIRKHCLADACFTKPFNLYELKTEISVLISLCKQLEKVYIKRFLGREVVEVQKSKSSFNADNEFLFKVRSFILEHIADERLGVEDISKEMAMSRTKFFNKIKDLTNEPPNNLIRKIRLEKAKELLESGQFQVQEIPEMVGMKSLKNFRILCKNKYGKTPSRILKNK